MKSGASKPHVKNFTLLTGRPACSMSRRPAGRLTRGILTGERRSSRIGWIQGLSIINTILIYYHRALNQEVAYLLI
jgi:hypothetical protein